MNIVGSGRVLLLAEAPLLDLLRPIYRKTTNYPHFGRPGLPWDVARAISGN